MYLPTWYLRILVFVFYRYYEADASKFQPIWDIIDRRWNRTLHKPIHGCAHFLNPQLFFEPTFDVDDDEVNGNVRSCIERMVPDFETRSKLRHDLVIYKSHTHTWSKDAKSSRFIMRPGIIFEMHNAIISHSLVYYFPPFLVS